jgi:hypothetical protein
MPMVQTAGCSKKRTAPQKHFRMRREAVQIAVSGDRQTATRKNNQKRFRMVPPLKKAEAAWRILPGKCQAARSCPEYIDASDMPVVARRRAKR